MNGPLENKGLSNFHFVLKILQQQRIAIKMAFKFSIDSVCNNANNSARRPKTAFLRFSSELRHGPSIFLLKREGGSLSLNALDIDK